MRYHSASPRLDLRSALCRGSARYEAAKAFNTLRKAYGLEPIGGRGAHEIFTRGTRTLYLDIPELYDLGPLSPTETYIGPVNWEPDIPLPSWWDALPDHKPVIFLSPGSSGDAVATLALIRALASLDLTLVVATAGRIAPANLPSSVFAAEWIPGLAAAQRADLVICNGGSPMVYLALGKGKPVLGIPQNHDQYYMMEALERKGAGKLIRSGRVDAVTVRKAVLEILGNPAFRQAAQRLQGFISSLNTNAAFTSVLETLIPMRDAQLKPGGRP